MLRFKSTHTAKAFTEANETRVNELTLLSETLSDFESKSALREEFTALFQQAVKSLELDEDTLADLLDTTRSTINRWRNGRNVPTRSLRKPIFNAIAKETRNRLKQHKISDRRVAAA